MLCKQKILATLVIALAVGLATSGCVRDTSATQYAMRSEKGGLGESTTKDNVRPAEVLAASAYRSPAKKKPAATPDRYSGSTSHYPGSPYVQTVSYHTPQPEPLPEPIPVDQLYSTTATTYANVGDPSTYTAPVAYSAYTSQYQSYLDPETIIPSASDVSSVLLMPPPPPATEYTTAPAAQLYQAPLPELEPTQYH